METITKYLNRQGKTLDGRPLWRLSWSETQLEKRRGTFNEFTESGIFIRTFVGVKETPKYPYIQNRWILERYVSPEQGYTAELPESRSGTYEPFYVFEDSKRNMLPVTLKAVEFIVSFAQQSAKVSPQDRKALVDKADAAEVAYFEDALECSEITNALHLHEGVSMYKTKERV